MPLRYGDVLARAWRMFRRDGDLLLRVTGPFVFLPSLALYLLVPPPPAPGADSGRGTADALAWAEALSGWASAHAGWYLLARVIELIGVAAVYGLYLAPARPDAGDALRRAVGLLPRFALLAALIAVPVAAGLLLWVLPGLYVAGRVMLAGPALLAEDRTSATSAAARSLALTRGSGLTLAALAGTVLIGGYLAGLFVGEGLSGPAGILAAAAAAGIGWAAAIAQALIAVACYRSLASRGS